MAYDSFRFTESVTLLAAVILGGMGTIPGAVLGASMLFILPEKLREFADYRLLLFGLGLIVIMRLRPQGLIADRHRRAELAREPRARMRRSRTSRRRRRMVPDMTDARCWTGLAASPCSSAACAR